MLVSKSLLTINLNLPVHVRSSFYKRSKEAPIKKGFPVRLRDITRYTIISSISDSSIPVIKLLVKPMVLEVEH